MSDLPSSVPEIRTTRRMAVFLSLGAFASIVVATMAGSQLEDLLGSETAALAIIVIWCVAGIGAAIAAIVDAFIKPEGEQLGMATAVAATVFAVLGLAVVSGVVAGAANLGQQDAPAENEARSAQSR